jgi:hypothetical protein
MAADGLLSNGRNKKTVPPVPLLYTKAVTTIKPYQEGGYETVILEIYIQA